VDDDRPGRGGTGGVFQLEPGQNTTFTHTLATGRF
jgi:hypothetical protein